MIWVTDAKALPDFCLWVRFSDNTEGEVDLKNFVASDPRPLVAALRDPAALKRFRETNQFWLEDYVRFKVIKEVMEDKSWEAWPSEFRDRNSEALQRFEKEHAQQIRFHEWLQWHGVRPERAPARPENRGL